MNEKKLTVLFIGGGNIAKIARKELEDIIEKAYYYDIVETDIKAIRLERFEIPNDVDIVIECASVGAVKEHTFKVLESGKDFYIISSGAFGDEKFSKEFLDRLEKSTSKVYIPSGAIGGLDIISAVKSKIISATLTMKKPPKAFGIESNVEKTIFEGSAVEAIQKFPQNTNVAITLLLAVGDSSKVKVKVIADPSLEKNKHEIEIVSEVGNYKIVHENLPSPNPKTSYLAPLSLISAIRKRYQKFIVGG